MELELILGGVAAVFLLVVVVIYNGLVAKKNAVEFAFAGIDVQLKKRYDLIPNLVAAARGYMAHEKSLLESLVALRSQAMATTTGSPANTQLNAQIATGLSTFTATAENYPELRSAEKFTLLMRSLNEIEEQLSAARRAFNAAIQDYNNGIEQFPSNLIASAMKYTQKQSFETADSQRDSVSVNKQVP